MIEGHFEQGAVITGFDFTDVKGTPLSEVSEGVVMATLTIATTKKVAIKFGFGSKIKRTSVEVEFQFLPYAQGAINYCESQGRDVVSAYFSGCIYARYTRAGAVRVCHVSTGGPDDCKDKWEQIKAEGEVGDVTEFKPHNKVKDGDKILGLITSTGDRYAIGCSATTVEQDETRSAAQILKEHTFTAGTTEPDKVQMAKLMSKAKRLVPALTVKSRVKV